MNIQILMSTYNGEKYIRTQLNSILEQEYQDFDLLFVMMALQTIPVKL